MNEWHFAGAVAVTFAAQAIFGPWLKAKGVGFWIVHLAVLLLGGGAYFFIADPYGPFRPSLFYGLVAGTGIVFSLVCRFLRSGTAAGDGKSLLRKAHETAEQKDQEPKLPLE